MSSDKEEVGQKKPTVPIVYNDFGSDLEIIDRVLTIYSAIKDIKLRAFERQVMTYYLKYGCNKDAHEHIRTDTGKTDSYIKVVNSNLRDLGLLEVMVNKHKNRLSSDMENLRKHFVEGNTKIYLVSFETPKVFKENAGDKQ